jgi:hypothetical protein
VWFSARFCGDECEHEEKKKPFSIGLIGVEIGTQGIPVAKAERVAREGDLLSEASPCVEPK